jgi:dihydrofolate reductase (trimethoprim resistance protein)
MTSKRYTEEQLQELLVLGIAAANAELAALTAGTFTLGDKVRKTKGAQWSGVVVGTYSTALTPEGYAVESSTEIGSVQIYPVAALERAQ